MTADAVGGVWQYSLDLAGSLRPRGVETTIAVLGPPPTDDQQRDAERAGVAIVVTELPLDWTATSAHEVDEAGAAILRLAEANASDVVHLNSPALAANRRFTAPVVAVAHSCVATWWRAVREGPLPPEFRWRSELVRLGYRAADAVLAPSEAFAEATQQIYRLAAKPEVVRNGRRASGVSVAGREETFVFTAGRLWDEGKNVGALDRAAGRISIPVVAAGPLSGPNGARVRVEHVRSLGALDDEGIARQLAKQPIFVSTALYEPFGLAVLEAAQAGCALVLSDIPTFREMWDGVATFVPPRSDEAVAAVIDHLARDPDARRRLGTAARDRAGSYSTEAMGSGVLAVYRSLLASGSKSRMKEAAA